MPFDALAYAGAIVREVKSTERDGKPAKAVVATATYETSLEDLWDAITTAGRIRRWFLPISGELRLGGRYQLEGNAGGTITACDAPRQFASTWEFGGQVSWIEVRLVAGKPGETTLELTHVAIVDDAFWPTYGPGAVGVGWDLGLLGLQRHIESPSAERPPEGDTAWATSAEALEFYRRASTAWGKAAAADGMVNAMEAAENTRKFYSGEAPPQAM
ncbi:MAG: SRPBCC family protein [Devosia sp.]|uniref:SRPBCC family protein n=1 Tax=Devosia sp. TaxID=1871048 RepID=UPI001A56AC33|nr:SRPBCC family protein [Devosia sp.]MBL8597658.1 SRPBCC family protein [Devosia sp.]